MKKGILITCEHASNRIPKEYASLFQKHKKILNSHKGLDIGSAHFYLALCEDVKSENEIAQWSRLLVELNRSQHHKDLFSQFTKQLSREEKERIIQKYYLPYRTNVQKKIDKLLKRYNQVIHLSIHSFTPKLNGQVRNADIGLLYDPKRAAERKFCFDLKHHFQQNMKQMKVRMNYPYKGTSDGLTKSLRFIYPSKKYIGVEFEVNQKHFQSISSSTKIITQLVTNLSNFLNR